MSAVTDFEFGPRTFGVPETSNPKPVVRLVGECRASWLDEPVGDGRVFCPEHCVSFHPTHHCPSGES